LQFLYNIGIYFTSFILKLIAFFDKKICLGVKGRANTFKILEKNLKPNRKTLWFHCASLGEYEQGLPLFEELTKIYKSHQIVLSFFSPSGYENKKHNSITDIVVYLPLDTKANAKRFVKLISPELSVFVKYDIWPNYLNAIKQRSLRAILISASFRKNQIYFKKYGKLFREALHTFEHIFTQNEASKLLLETINYKEITVSGDTRFDRVSKQLLIDNSLDFIAKFKQNNLCVVVGSSWPEDEALFLNFINYEKPKAVKYIFAPHNIKHNQIKNFAAKLNAKTILYSEMDISTIHDFDVLVIDTIGLLSKIYYYADITYVGGAMGNTGLHNTLEPAVFGVPILIGNNYRKFPEAISLIEHGGLFPVSSQTDFDSILKRLIEDAKYRKTTGLKNSEFVKQNIGAVNKIVKYLTILENYPKDK